MHEKFPQHLQCSFLVFVKENPAVLSSKELHTTEINDFTHPVGNKGLFPSLHLQCIASMTKLRMFPDKNIFCMALSCLTFVLTVRMQVFQSSLAVFSSRMISLSVIRHSQQIFHSHFRFLSLFLPPLFVPENKCGAEQSWSDTWRVNRLQTTLNKTSPQIYYGLQQLITLNAHYLNILLIY